MITNFEDITKPLTDLDMRLVKILIDGFSARTKNNPIKAPDIIRKINANAGMGKTIISQPKLRKLCNYIRSNGLCPLIATSNGYYTSTDKTEILQQIKSLRERAEAILKSSVGLEKFLIQ